MHPLLIGNLDERFRFKNAEIIDQYVKVGVYLGQSGGDLGQTKISDETFYFRGPVFLLDRIDRRVHSRLGSTGDNHSRSLASYSPRDGKSDSRSGTGYQGR